MFISITEQPEWLLPTLSPARTVNITNSGLTAMCKVRGRPQPTVKWFKDGIEITSSSAYFRIIPIVTPIDGHSNNVTSILQWTGQGRKRDSKTTEYSLRKEDTGVYSCRVTSTVSQPISLDHELSVNCEYNHVLLLRLHLYIPKSTFFKMYYEKQIHTS